MRHRGRLQAGRAPSVLRGAADDAGRRLREEVEAGAVAEGLKSIFG